MMSGDNFSNDSCRARLVLGDVTNRPLKRGSSSILGGLGLKSRNGIHYNEENERDSQFAKQVCLGVEKLVKEKCRTLPRVESSEKQSSGSSSTCSDTSAKNITSIDWKNNSDGRMEVNNLLDGNAVEKRVVDVEDTSRDGCLVGLPDKCSQTYQKNDDEEPRFASNTKESCMVMSEALERHASKSDSKDLSVGRLASGKGGSSEWSRLPKTQCSRSLELDKCVGIKNDGCTNMNLDVDSLKACSCSFCLKAANIWSDLHYRDIKGRLAVLKKSQKEASILAQKCGREKQTDVHGLGNNEKSSKLESDLMNQWRSLFLNMEDIFVRESNQLQASYVMLKDLKENCKMDLERATGMLPEKQ
ncbi:hypothetical protein SLA2020_083330 [Shorea laevis]